MYYYKGFGITIASEIEVPELYPVPHKSPNKSVATIELGKTPAKLIGNNIEEKVINSYGTGEYLVQLDNVARYHVYKGSNITIQPLGENTDWKSIRLFLLNTAIPALLYQIKKLIFNAHVLTLKNEAILFMSSAQTPKSEIVTSLINEHFTLFSDNMCVVDTDNIKPNQTFVDSSFPVHYLRSKSVAHFHNYSTKEVINIRENIPIQQFYFHDSYISNPLPIKLIIILSVDNNILLRCKVITEKSQKINLLYKFLAKKEMMLSILKRAYSFSTIIEIIKTNIPIVEVSMPNNYDIAKTSQYFRIQINKYTNSEC